jgi:hypothetical protein
MACGLIESQPRRGFFFNDQKSPIPLNQSSNSHTWFPAYFMCIHNAYFTESPCVPPKAR